MADTENNKNFNSPAERAQGNAPALRFPGFTEPWRKFALGEIVSFEKKRIRNYDLRLTEYVSTDSMLADFGGIRVANRISETGTSTSFIKGDILVSNICPYLNKIWCATFDGGCSPDVFVYRAKKELVTSPFLYNILANNAFITYVMNGAKGVKMPRGDKEQMMKYPCSIPTLQEQDKISSLLQFIDERIATQRRLIDKLETLIKGIVVSHFNNCNTKKSIAVKDLGEAYSVGNLSKDDLSEYGEQCIIYGELFTTYGCVAREIHSRTNKYSQATLSRSGDLLFPASTTVDAISLIAPTSLQRDGVYVAGDMFGIHISPQFNSEYISYLLNYVYNKTLSKYAQGSTIIHLHYADIKNTTIQVPCLEEQKKCAELMEGLQTKLDVAKRLIDCYQLQKSNLLQHMFI